MLEIVTINANPKQIVTLANLYTSTSLYISNDGSMH